MKKLTDFLWIIAIGAIIGFTVAGCDNNGDDEEDPVPVNVTGYSLKASEASDAENATSGVTLDSATLLNEVVTLKLKGEVTGAYILKAPGTGDAAYTKGYSFEPSANFWVDDSTKPAAGTYAPVYIKGLFNWTEADTSKVLAIKNTNQALRLYAGNTSGLLTDNPTKPKLTDSSNQQTIWIPTTNAEPVRWKLYLAIPKDDTFGILIWNGGSGTTYTQKTATLVIQEYDGYDSSVTVGADTTQSLKTGGYSTTVIVDYSSVTFAEDVIETEPQ